MRRIVLLTGLGITAAIAIVVLDPAARFAPDVDPALLMPTANPQPPSTADREPAQPFAAAHLDARPAAPAPYAQGMQQRFTDLLGSATADVVVAPCGVAPVGRALERVERLLLSTQVAHALQHDTTLRVADPLLVARALGEGRRVVDRAAVAVLARKVGARSYIVCTTRWQNRSADDLDARLDIDFEYFDTAANDAAGAKSRARAHLGDLEFDHERLPHAVLRPRIDGILAQLGFPAVNAPEATPAPDRDAAPVFALPLSPETLLEPTTSAEAAVWRLLFLAALFPETPGLGRERLHVQALLAAYALADGTPHKQVMIARALFRLERRPAALAALRDDDTPAGIALRAALDGNLPALEATAANIPPGIPAVLAAFDTVDLAFEYEALPEAEIEQRRKETAALLPAWAPFVRQRLGGFDLWQRIEPLEVKHSLDRVFPLPGASVTEQAEGGAVLGESSARRGRSDLAVRRHIDRLYAEQGETWRDQANLTMVDALDLLDLYESAMESALAKRVHFTLVAQGRPAAALAELDAIETTFRGHPEFTYLRAASLYYEAGTLSGGERAELLRVVSGLIRDTVLWADGQTWTSALALNLGNDTPDMPPAFSDMHHRNALVTDFPVKPYWPPWSHGGALDVMANTLNQQLLYSAHDYAPVERGVRLFFDRADPGAALAFLASLGDRFAGSARHTELQVDLLLDADRVAEALLLLRRAIDAGSPQWSLYERYARIQIEHGQYDAAFTATLAYPPFTPPTRESPVALSSASYTVGSLFFWRGLIEQAETLYRMAANFGSGSEGELASRQRLALLERDFHGAALVALDRARRYNSVYAYRDYLALLFALGYEDQAWQGFEQLAASRQGAPLWEAADVGKRISATSDADVVAWVGARELRGASFGATPGGIAQALRFFLMDRDPPPQLEAVFTDALTEHRTRFTVDRRLVVRARPLRGGDHIDDVVGPSFYRGYAPQLLLERASLPVDSDPPPEAGDPRANVPSEYVLFLRAYVAWRAGDQTRAVESFETLARHYEIARRDTLWMLPYFAEVIAASDGHEALSHYLEAFTPRARGFDWHLAQSFLAARMGDTDRVLVHLEAALDQRPHTDERPVLTGYQWAQACEALLSLTKDDRLRESLLEWSRRMQRIEPYLAWPYAIEAQYTLDRHARDIALGMSMRLDPGSTRLHGFSAADKERAARSIAAQNPFDTPRPMSGGHGA